MKYKCVKIQQTVVSTTLQKSFSMRVCPSNARIAASAIAWRANVTKLNINTSKSNIHLRVTKIHCRTLNGWHTNVLYNAIRWKHAINIDLSYKQNKLQEITTYINKTCRNMPNVQFTSHLFHAFVTPRRCCLSNLDTCGHFDNNSVRSNKRKQ